MKWVLQETRMVLNRWLFTYMPDVQSFGRIYLCNPMTVKQGIAHMFWVLYWEFIINRRNEAWLQKNKQNLVWLYGMMMRILPFYEVTGINDKEVTLTSLTFYGAGKTPSWARYDPFIVYWNNLPKSAEIIFENLV